MYIVPFLRPLILQPDSASYGACRSLLRTIQAMPPDSVRPVVVFPYSGDALFAYEQAGCEVVVMPLAVLRRTDSGLKGLWRLARMRRRSARALADLAKSKRCDLIHTNSMTIVSGTPAARRAGIPHVWQLREAPSERGAKAWVLCRLLARADRVIAISVQSASFGPRERTRIVRNGYDRPERSRQSEYTHTSAPAGESRIAPSRPGELTVGMVGRISPTKGQHIAIEALGRAMRLVIVGDTYPGHEAYEAERVRARIAELGLAERVDMLGFLQHVEPVYEQLDVLVVATKAGEGFCMAALEAMAHGVPVVSCASGGIEELVLDERTGIVCKPGSIDDVATALRRLRDDPDFRLRLGEGARAHASKFSVQASAVGLLREWNAAVRRHNRA